MTRPLDAGFLRDCVEQGVAPWLSFISSITYVEETTSTNDIAAEAARKGAPHGAIFLAEHQTQGRGRGGRAWASCPRESILVSMVLRPSEPVETMSSLALAVGLGVAEVMQACTSGKGVAIKWPNDVLLWGKKVAGVLVEASFTGDRCDFVVVGVGINVYQTQFEPPLADIATSLAMESVAPKDRESVLLTVLTSMYVRFLQFAHSGLFEMQDDLRKLDATKGCLVRVGDCEGVSDGIDVSGGLRVIVDGVPRVVCAGELCFLARPAQSVQRRQS